MIISFVVRFFVFLFELIPFSVIKSLSKFLSFLLAHIFKYRKSVINKNLQLCFPDLSSNDLKTLRGKIYDNLAVILLEGLKGLSLKKKVILERNKFNGTEIVTQFLNKGQSVICVCPHYHNWEWTVLATGYNFPNKSIGIYKEINNSRVNAYIKGIRAKSRIMLLSTHETRFITEEIPKGKVILLMSDQNPSNLKDAIWVKFFGHETACLHGLEKYARKYNLPICYLDQQKVSDSAYSVEISLLCGEPLSFENGMITQLFMSKLESVIRKNPSPWLWSHKRWKNNKEVSY
ncbi:MAG: hypothetical protein ABI851_00795 [Saprospiraceae bacterium]